MVTRLFLRVIVVHRLDWNRQYERRRRGDNSWEDMGEEQDRNRVHRDN